VISVGVATGCTVGSTLTDLQSGQWVKASVGLGCGYFAEIFAGSVGVVVAGAASPTGPGAVAIGVAAYRALAAGLKVACGGLLDGGANALGQYLEAKHETAVAVDVERRGLCIQMRQFLGTRSWSAVPC
jgi:hypothetical protein